MKRTLQLFLGIFFLFSLTLGLAGAASANNVNIAFTATCQESEMEIRTNVWEFKTRKVKITQKDVLVLLGMIYSLPSGSPVSLAYGGSFRILDEDGATLHNVDAGDLTLTPSGDQVVSGIQDYTLGGKDKYKQVRPSSLILEIDSEHHFSLPGQQDVSYSDAGFGPTKILYNLILIGGGGLAGDACNISGKMKITM